MARRAPVLALLAGTAGILFALVLRTGGFDAVLGKRPARAPEATARGTRPSDPIEGARSSPPPRPASLAPPPRLEGRIMDQRGVPLLGALVRVLQPPASEGAPSPLPASTDTQGRFRIDGVPPGPFAILASRPGYAPRRVAAARAGEPLEVRLAPDDPARAARRRSLEARISEVGRDLVTAQGATRAALEQRGRILLAELEALEAGPDGDGGDAR